MAHNKIKHFKPGSKQKDVDAQEDRAKFELYQAFMIGYVRRINEASFNVTIGGVRIGSAKYSRLAQINLQSRIITFSRFAVENVPERGRRYLVLHELAHVKEANHNNRFWQHVERYEPNYKKVSHELELAFKNNVREEHQRLKKMSFSNSLSGGSREGRSSTGVRMLNYKLDQKLQSVDGNGQTKSNIIVDPNDDTNYECMEEEFSQWDIEEASGIVNGGSNFEEMNSDFIQLKLFG